MSEALNEPRRGLPAENGVYQCVKAEYEITLSTEHCSRLHIETPDGKLTLPVEELEMKELDRTVTITHEDATMSQVIESEHQMFVQLHRDGNGDNSRAGSPPKATLVSQ